MHIVSAKLQTQTVVSAVGAGKLPEGGGVFCPKGFSETRAKHFMAVWA